MPEHGADPAPPPLPVNRWTREYAETVTQPEPPVADSGPVTPLEIMQMQRDTARVAERTEPVIGGNP